MKHRGIAQLVEQRSPKPRAVGSSPTAPAIFAAMAQVVEHVLGKDEVTGSNPVSSSKKFKSSGLNFFIQAVGDERSPDERMKKIYANLEFK